MRYKIFILLLLLSVIPVASATSIFGNYTGVSWTLDAYATGITMNDDYFWVTCIEENTGVYKYYNNGTRIGFDFHTKYNGNNLPQGIAMNESYFWVVDRSDNLVYIYHSNGTYTNNSWDTAACGNGDPYGIDKNDTYFLIVDEVDDEVYFYHLNGTSAGISFDTAACGNNDPQGIVIGSSYIWITDDVDHKVYQYHPNGTYAAVSGTITSYPQGIIKDDIYFWVIHDFKPGFKAYQYYASNFPTIPALVSPLNNTIQRSTPVTLDVSSTDTDGDPITYYYYGGTSPTSMSFIGTNDTGGSSLNWTIYDCDTYYWTANANDSYGSSDNMNTVQFTAIVPPQSTTNLISNGSFENWSGGATADPDSWSTPFTTTNNASRITDAMDGTYAAEFVNMGPGDARLVRQDSITTEAGKPYSIGFWAKEINDVDHLIFKMGDGNTDPISTFNITTDWNWYENSFSRSTTTTTFFDFGGNFGTARMDGILLMEGLEAAVLPSPANGSTIYSTYPPLTYDVTFDWQNTSTSQYQIQVAEDINFNVMVIDTHTSSHSLVESLQVNKEYYWRVYSYDGTYYSDASDIWNFNLVGNSSLTGSAIEGVTYQVVDGSYTQLNGVEITIWNNTWTDHVITGSNGYYLFEDLENGTVYSLQAKADRFLDSSVALVNVTSSPTTKNFYLIEDLTDTEWWHYVEFKVQSIWGTVYPDVTSIVYLGDSITPHTTGTTGSDGTVTFHLNQNVEYRITFINTDLGINEEIIIYPSAKSYTIYVDTYSFDPPDLVTDDISAYIESSRINSTHGYINFTWADSSDLTTAIEYSISDINGNELYNTSNAGPDMFDSQIVAAIDVRYIVHYEGIHPTHGTIEKTTTVVFKGGRIIDLGWPEDWMYAVTAIAFMIFIGAVFGAQTAHYGAVAVVIIAWFFKWIGWLDNTNTSTILLILATVVAVGWALRKGEGVKT